MDREDKKLLNLSTMLLNTMNMMLYLLTAIVAMSIGLYFYFVVTGNAGYGIGIAMFIISAIIFVIGELMFFKNMGKLKMHGEK